MHNTALLEAAMTHILDNPELHTQEFYFEATEFGIAACFGGRVCLLAGYEPVYNIDGTHGSNVRCKVFNVEMHAYQVAMALLGIDREWAVNLFDVRNTADMLQMKVKDLINGSPLRTYDECLSVGA